MTIWNTQNKWDYNNMISGFKNYYSPNNTTFNNPLAGYTPDQITQQLRLRGADKTIGDTGFLDMLSGAFGFNGTDPKTTNSFWNNFASGLGSNLLSGIGSIWNGYNTYKTNKENLALAKEQLALQKENYYNNERRLEANFQDVQQARRASRL